MNARMILTPGHDALHGWFGLSYAAYITIPRSFAQSMPDKWQGRMAALLEEADEVACKHNFDWPGDGLVVNVQLRDSKGKFVKDDLADYQRGRRRLW